MNQKQLKRIFSCHKKCGCFLRHKKTERECVLCEEEEEESSDKVAP